MKSSTWKRIVVGAATTATVGATLPWLVGLPAQAAINRIAITGPSSLAAGNCQAYTATVYDPFGAPVSTSSDSGFLTVKLSENPSSSTQDVDFCTPGVALTPYREPAATYKPHYRNAPTGSDAPDPGGSGTSSTQYYDPGPSVRPTGLNDAPTGTADNPDRAEMTGGSINFLGQGGSPAGNNINPTGVDTAQFVFAGTATPPGQVVFGLVARTTGSARIDAFWDRNGDESPAANADNNETSNDIAAPQYTVNITPGGPPGSAEVHNAVTNVQVTCSPVPPAPRDGCYGGPKDSYAAVNGSKHYFKAVLRNTNGDLIQGATPQIAAIAGPNAPTQATPNGTFTASCEESKNDGVSLCNYQGQLAGTDTVRVWVNHTGSTATTGLDSGEPSDAGTAVTSAASAGAAAARFINLTPDAATTTAGQSQRFVALVTARDGTPVKGAGIAFGESGPGVIQNASEVTTADTSRSTATTDETGRAVVTILTSTTDRGVETITASVTNAGSECTATDAPAGNCSDSSTNTISGASPSPSASGSRTPTPVPTTSGSTTPTPTTSQSRSPGATTSASSTPSGACGNGAVTSLPQSYSLAGRTAQVNVTGQPGSVVDLYAYSRPQTTFRVVRSAQLESSGSIAFFVAPGTNTRLYAQQRGCSAGNQVVLNVRTGLSIAARRLGTRTYLFSGDSVPARPGGLIISLYRVTSSGAQVLTGQVRASSTDGRWSLTRKFTGTGRFGFLVRTGQDLQNAPGASNVRPTLIY